MAYAKLMEGKANEASKLAKEAQEALDRATPQAMPQ